jgi:N,N'-diacetyllegionaminate synthase
MTLFKQYFIGSQSPCYIIGEIGVNHNGDLNNAYKLIDIAIKAGVNAVKFQTYNTDLLVNQDACKAEYQKINTNNDDSQYSMLKKLELSNEAFLKINKYCNNKNITFISTPFDNESVDLLEIIDVPFYKIGSGDLLNLPLLLKIVKTRKPMIISTGMSNIHEIKTTIKFIEKQGYNNDILLLHCVSSYPTILEDLNLKCITTLKQQFPQYSVGLSDHSESFEAAIIAVTFGAVCIEKHFTLDKNMEGPDHKASLNPNELELFVKKIKETSIMIGNGIKICKELEKNTKTVARRSLVYIRNIKKGEIITEDDIIGIRPNNGISTDRFEEFINKKINKNVNKMDLLNVTDFYK